MWQFKPVCIYSILPCFWPTYHNSRSPGFARLNKEIILYIKGIVTLVIIYQALLSLYDYYVGVSVKEKPLQSVKCKNGFNSQET